jgi:hypothetical protein
MIVEYYYNSSWEDISDYVVEGTDKVPYISRNRDFTLRLEIWRVTIAQTLKDNPTFSGWENFTAGDRIRITSGATTLFVGYVLRSPLNYSTLEFDVQVITDINKLQNYLVDYDTLHSTISGGSPSTTEYRAYSYYIMPTIHITYLIKKMFAIAGLTLDTSNVDDETAFTYIWDEGEETEQTMTVTYKDLFIGESELYCLSNSVNAYHTIIDYVTYDYKKEKISFFDFVSPICSYLGFTIDIVSTDNYELNLVTDNYTIDDDSKYDYVNEPYQGDTVIDKLGVSVSMLSFYDLHLVLSGNANPNEQNYTLGEGSGIDYLQKLRLYFIKEMTPFDNNKVVPIATAVKSTVYIDMQTTISHGINNGDYIMIFGVAGMDDLNCGFYGPYYQATRVFDVNLVGVSKDIGTTYIEGGWIYKDLIDIADFRIGTLRPIEITENTLMWNGVLNPLRHQIRSKVTNYVKEEIYTEEQTTLASILENNIDIKFEKSDLIQETYDLPS